MSKTILYIRVPGMLAMSAAVVRTSTNVCCPTVVTEGRFVRDTCTLALAQGVRMGAPVTQARRLCPSLLAVPVEEVDAHVLQGRFLDILAAFSSVVEPEDLDTAYVDLTYSGICADDIRTKVASIMGLSPVVGMGISRLASRAVAESGIEILEDAAVQWLWPDDPAVTGRLQRLGLATFGAVAAVSEEALRLHFGKIAPLLHRRAHGIDLTPVRALYPAPCAEVIINCEDAPVDNQQILKQMIARASKKAEYQLQGLGVGRHLHLEMSTERGNVHQEWAVPVPVEYAAEIQSSLWRMVSQTRLLAPVTRLHIRIEDVSIPSAHTADLFGMHADAIALEAVKRRLSARFGLTTLKILGQQPRTAREKRRAAVREAQRAQV